MAQERGRNRNPLHRPGRPRRSTYLRTERRREIEQNHADNPIPIDDLEHGTAEIPIHYLAKGRVIERYIFCGRAKCRCRSSGRGHGPYNYLVMTIPKSMREPDGPRQRWVYLTKAEAQRYRARIANFNKLINNMFSDLLEEFDA